MHAGGTQSSLLRCHSAALDWISVRFLAFVLSRFPRSALFSARSSSRSGECTRVSRALVSRRFRCRRWGWWFVRRVCRAVWQHRRHGQTVAALLGSVRVEHGGSRVRPPDRYAARHLYSLSVHGPSVCLALRCACWTCDRCAALGLRALCTRPLATGFAFSCVFGYLTCVCMCVRSSQVSRTSTRLTAATPSSKPRWPVRSLSAF